MHIGSALRRACSPIVLKASLQLDGYYNACSFSDTHAHLHSAGMLVAGVLGVYRQMLAGTDTVHAASKMRRTKPADLSDGLVRPAASMADNYIRADDNLSHRVTAIIYKLLHHLCRLCQRMRPDVWRMFVSGPIPLAYYYPGTKRKGKTTVLMYNGE